MGEFNFIKIFRDGSRMVVFTSSYDKCAEYMSEIKASCEANPHIVIIRSDKDTIITKDYMGAESSFVIEKRNASKKDLILLYDRLESYKKSRRLAKTILAPSDIRKISYIITIGSDTTIGSVVASLAKVINTL